MSLYQPYALVRVRLLVNAQYRYHVEWQHFLFLFWSGHQNMRHDKTLAVSTCAHHLLNTMYIPTAPDLRNALCALSEVQTRSPFDRRLPPPPPAATSITTTRPNEVRDTKTRPCVCVCASFELGCIDQHAHGLNTLEKTPKQFPEMHRGPDGMGVPRTLKLKPKHIKRISRCGRSETSSRVLVVG